MSADGDAVTGKNAGDAEPDAWLRTALRHAPDASATPPAALRQAILAEARAASRTAPPRGASAAPGFLTQLTAWWDWLARPPVAAGFATVAMATVIGVLWHDRPLEETLPDVGRPVPTAAVPGAAQVAPTAPGATLPSEPSVAAKSEALRREAQGRTESSAGAGAGGGLGGTVPSSADTASPQAGAQAPTAQQDDQKADASAARRPSVPTPRPALAAPPLPAPEPSPAAAAAPSPAARPAPAPAPAPASPQAPDAAPPATPSAAPATTGAVPPPPSAFPGGAGDATADRQRRSDNEAPAASRRSMEARRGEAARSDPAQEAKAPPTDSMAQAEGAAQPSVAPDPAGRRAERSTLARPAAPSRDLPLPSPSAAAPAAPRRDLPLPSPPAAAPAAPRRDAPLPAPPAAPGGDAPSPPRAGFAGRGPGEAPLASATAPQALARTASPFATVFPAIDAEPARWRASTRTTAGGAGARRALDAPLRQWLAGVEAVTADAWRAASAEDEAGEPLATVVLRQDDRIVATLSLSARGATVRTHAPAGTPAASSRSVFAPLAPAAAARLAASLPR